ncbi:hypothetical protein SCALM49S_00984 [Streptomyces californicus]
MISHRFQQPRRPANRTDQRLDSGARCRGHRSPPGMVTAAWPSRGGHPHGPAAIPRTGGAGVQVARDRRGPVRAPTIGGQRPDCRTQDDQVIDVVTEGRYIPDGGSGTPLYRPPVADGCFLRGLSSAGLTTPSVLTAARPRASAAGRAGPCAGPRSARYQLPREDDDYMNLRMTKIRPPTRTTKNQHLEEQADHEADHALGDQAAEHEDRNDGHRDPLHPPGHSREDLPHGHRPPPRLRVLASMLKASEAPTGAGAALEDP